MALIDRRAEQQALDDLLENVRAGTSGALVVRGEPGIGKSTLLDHAVASARDFRTLRTVAVESEKRLGFAAVHQLLRPLLDDVDTLPGPQRRALGVAFGLVSEAPADPFLVGLAVLTLLSDAAEDRPVLCVVDDAQWLDDESSETLGFAARRLLADRVGMLFAVRETVEPDPHLQALPALRVAGLPAQDAHQLLTTALTSPVDAGVAERIVAETGGNPLAVVDATRELTTEQLAGRSPLPEPLPVGRELDGLFVRRVRELPSDTQTLLLLAAAEHAGRGGALWDAAAALGVPESAAFPAESAGLVSFWPEVRFSHPLVRSAVYHAATPVERRRVHRALAAACHPELDADARAWHLAAAAAGPDECVAAEQEAAAHRVARRGGCAAAAQLWERAALLSPDRGRRGERRLAAAEAHLLAGAVDQARALLAEAVPDLQNPLSAARAARLEGRIDFARGRVAESASALVGAARRLRPLDRDAARDTLLSAVEATVFAGWASSGSLLREIARTTGDLPLRGDSPPSALDLLLQGYAARVTDGYSAAVPALRGAIRAFLAEEVDPGNALRRLELAAIAASDLLDDDATERLTSTWVAIARETGALTRLAGALAFRAAFVEAPAGRLAAARAAEAEAHELAEVTHNPAVVPPTGAHTLLTLALSGRAADTRVTAASVAREAPGRGATGEMVMAEYFVGVLEISLGDYESAVVRLNLGATDDTPLTGTLVLPDLVEAATRAGQPDVAEAALTRLADRANATGTPLALGLLARSRALLADPDEARGHFEQALGLLGRTRSVPQLARAHLLYGEWLRRQRRRREAREHLRTAHDMFDAMGLDAFADRAGAELRATGERARKREVGVPEDLTPQEAQIAALVSRGDPNRAIAAQLFISPSTVEYHLRKVFRKLGVTSRSQLTRHMVENDSRAAGSVPRPRGPVTGDRT